MSSKNETTRFSGDGATLRDLIVLATRDGFETGLEKAATLVEQRAQDFSRMRDPGMANHCRALARHIRDLANV